MIEHLPWIGPDYQKRGLNGQKVALVGYSHWADEDGNDFTEDTVEKIINGTWNISFFTNIRNYFGYDNHAEFWPRVVFFNYLPSYVGGADQRYANGSLEQIEQARARFLRLLKQYKPDKVIVFTTKGWSQLPETDEEKTGRGTFQLWPDDRKFRWGTFGIDGKLIKVFGLRHPQGASFELMKRAVRSILEH